MESNDKLEQLLKQMYSQETLHDDDIDTSDIIDEEWTKFEAEHFGGEQRKVRPPFLKIAALFIGVLMLSGIAYAAIHISHHYSHDAEDQQRVVTVEKKKPAAQEPVAKDSTIVTQPIVFDNVSLDKIARTIADYHHKEAEVKNDQAVELRFYFVWNQTDSLQTVVEQLNQFERVDIVVENDKLIVR